MTVFFGWRAGNFTLMRDKSLFEFLNLFIIFDDLTLDLRNDCFTGLRYILLSCVHIVEEWVRLFAFHRCTWNLWSALHLGWQIPRLKLRKLILNLLLFLLSDRPTHVVVIDVLLCRVYHRVCVLDTSCLRGFYRSDWAHRRSTIHVGVWALATDSTH